MLTSDVFRMALTQGALELRALSQNLNILDAIGYLASALVIAAFGMRTIVALRVVAICSNIAFIAYGCGLGLVHVWLLHTILLPMNGWHLLRGTSRSGTHSSKSDADGVGVLIQAP